MGFKQFIVALLLAGAVAPASGAEPWDPRTYAPGLMYFVRIPLDATERKERDMVFGLTLRGMREKEFVYLDTTMLNFIDGGISAKFLIAGAVALGAAMAVGGGGGGSSSSSAPAKPAASTSTSTSTSTSSTSTAPPAPCPEVCPPRR
jgi:hypothetical protein